MGRLPDRRHPRSRAGNDRATRHGVRRITTFVASAAVVASALVVLRRSAGGELIVLSVVMLLVGGGFGPPILGSLAARVAVGAGSPRRGCRRLLDGCGCRRLAALRPPRFWLGAANAVLLVIGSLTVSQVVDVAGSDVFVVSLLVAVPGLPPATLAHLARGVHESFELVLQ